MDPITAALVAGGTSVLGGLFQRESADAAADAQVEAAKLGIAYQRDATNKSLEIANPAYQRGEIAASTQMDALGLPTVTGGPITAIGAGLSGGTGGNGGIDWSRYLQDNPDVLQAAHASGQDPIKFAEIHYRTHGQFEKSRAPVSPTGGGAYEGGAFGPETPTPPSAEDAFRSSAFYDTAMGQTPFLMEGINSQKGALGSLYSGSTVNASVDGLKRLESDAFGRYYNALAGVSGTGQVAGGSAMGAIDAFGAGANAGANAQGEARASAYGAFNPMDAFASGSLAYGMAGGGFGGGSKTKTNSKSGYF